MGTDLPLGGSFRDPDGFVFSRDGRILRQVNLSYRDDYDLLLSSGLYDSLVGRDLLVSHSERPDEAAAVAGCAYKVIEPERIPFISHPFEWSFSQLKRAAQLTLAVQRAALDHGMCLKDASGYNVQFRGLAPVLIDTLSFGRYREGEPWAAYGQFCRHFLAPLALMSLVDVRLGGLLAIHIDGVPLDLAASLLASRMWLRPSLAVHLGIHARSCRREEAQAAAKSPRHGSFTSNAMRGLVDNLQAAVDRLVWSPDRSAWTRYYESHSYPTGAFSEKMGVVAGWLQDLRPAIVWDLGANTGVFSRLAAHEGALAVSMDSDPGAVERNFVDSTRESVHGVLPLLVDVANPSPATGWQNHERASLLARGPADAALALALIHHLAIASNVPFGRIADLCGAVCRHLVIEFVPKDDPQVAALLRVRPDIFPGYTKDRFESEFARRFTIRASAHLGCTGRILYYMEKGGQG